MANCHNLFQEFNENLNITETKREKLIKSKDNLREKIQKYFEKEHPNYKPRFYIQGSFKMKSIIRTKDDTCDLDDGVYFKSNLDSVTCSTLQKWVKDSVSDVTDATPSHRKKCITVDYSAGYNIDLPVLIFDSDKNQHPSLAVKDGVWQDDDPREFILEFNKQKDKDGQLIRIVKYLKSWCDYKRDKMPSGLSMTVLAMKYYQSNQRDDVALKFLLVEIEKHLKINFQCLMPTTPKDDLFENYDETRKTNFMNNLAIFKSDAKKAIEEERNHLKASKIWQKHFGDKYFPNGKDEEEKGVEASLLSGVIGSARPYYGI